MSNRSRTLFEECAVRRRVKKAGVVFLLLGLLLCPLVEAVPLGRRAEMENGLTLLVAERPTLPMVTVQILLKTGSVLEPKDKAGLAHLTAALLPLGTVSRTAPEISEAIEFVGGGLNADASWDSSSLSLTVLKKDLDMGMALLADVLLHPAFREAEIARKVQELKGRIRQKQEDPGTVARETFAATLFGDHPYGRPVEGTEGSLDRITRQDLVDFHRRYYVPNNSIMVAGGDVTLEELKGYVQKYLKAWARGSVGPVKAASGAPPRRRQVVKIDRGVTQGGGGLTSRLMRSIREKQGWAYDVHSALGARRFPGPFLVALQTKNETASPAIEEVLKQIREIRNTGVTAEELEEAKGFLTGSFPLRFDTNQDVVGLLAGMEFYGLGMDYPERYPEIIQAVTREDVLRVARKYLHPDRGILVVIADPDKAKLPF